MERTSVFLVSLLFLLSVVFPVQATANDTIEDIGTIGRFAIPASAAGFALYKKDTNGLVQFGASLGATLLLTEGLKRSVGERRPNGSCCKSFPSGHAAWAFSGAAFLHRRYGFKYSLPAYLFASFVGYSRVQADKHYVHDVLAGAALAIGVHWLIVKPFKNKDATLAVMPVADGSYHGIAAFFRS